MKAKFFMCIRPPVIETDDEHYQKPSPTPGSPYTTFSGKSSGRRNREIFHRKKVAPEKYTPENPLQKHSQMPSKITSSVSEPCISKSFSDEGSVSLKKLNIVLNDEVNGGVKSNSGGYVIVSTLFFTMFFGKFFGILCTMILVCSLYSYRKNDGSDAIRVSENMVVNSPEKGSPEEYRKRVIMAGLLERKNHYRS